MNIWKELTFGKKFRDVISYIGGCFSNSWDIYMMNIYILSKNNGGYQKEILRYFWI